MIKKFTVILLVSILFSCNNNSEKSEVTISKRQILVNDIPYLIKGICYNPVPKGNEKRSFNNLTEDLALMAEAGADSYMTVAKNGYEKGENEKAQADATANILEAIFRNQEICSGVTLFAFVDELWKAGNNDKLDPGGAPNSIGVSYDGSPNEEYWGILDIDRNKKQAFEVVKEKYLEQN